MSRKRMGGQSPIRITHLFSGQTGVTVKVASATHESPFSRVQEKGRG